MLKAKFDNVYHGCDLPHVRAKSQTGRQLAKCEILLQQQKKHKTRNV